MTFGLLTRKPGVCLLPTHRHILITGGNGYIGTQMVAMDLD